MSKPPEIDPDKLDFSLFHPLDHYLWESRCQEFYGGPTHHIRLWWEFIGSHWLHRNTLCRLGKHYYTDGWSRQPDGSYKEFRACVYCMKDEGKAHTQSKDRPW